MPAEFQFTRHAAERFGQRGFRPEDLDLLSLIGRSVEGGLFVCRKDAQRLAGRLRQIAERCERLAGTRLVAEDGAIISAYRPGRRKTRRLIRNTEQRSLEGDWP